MSGGGIFSGYVWPARQQRPRDAAAGSTARSDHFPGEHDRVSDPSRSSPADRAGRGRPSTTVTEVRRTAEARAELGPTGRPMPDLPEPSR